MSPLNVVPTSRGPSSVPTTSSNNSDVDDRSRISSISSSRSNTHQPRNDAINIEMNEIVVASLQPPPRTDEVRNGAITTTNPGSSTATATTGTTTTVAEPNSNAFIETATSESGLINPVTAVFDTTTTTGTTSTTTTMRMISYLPVLRGLVQLNGTTVKTNCCSAGGNSKSSMMMIQTPTAAVAVHRICQWWRTTKQSRRVTEADTTSSSNDKKRTRYSVMSTDSFVPSKRVKWSPPVVVGDGKESFVFATTDATNHHYHHHHHHWVWDMLQSYSEQERWYATKLVLQEFLGGFPSHHAANDETTVDTTTTSVLSSTVVVSASSTSHYRYEFVRCLIEYIRRPYLRCYHDHNQCHPFDNCRLETNTMTKSTTSLSTTNLTEWCAVFQFVIFHGLRSSNHNSGTDVANERNDRDVVVQQQQQSEIVAIVYHYWSWFCETLWQTSTSSKSSQLQQHQQYNHILSFIRMLYAATISCSDDILLPVMKLLNRACLWSTKLLVISSSSGQNDDGKDDRTDIAGTERPPEPLSPLACLIATYYRIKSNDESSNVSSMIEAQHLLGQMINCRTTVSVVKKKATASSNRKTTGDDGAVKRNKSKTDDVSIKTAKASNILVRTIGNNSNNKEIMIRFADEEDDDGDDVVDESNDTEQVVRRQHDSNHENEDDDDDKDDEFHSVMLQSDHNSDDSSHSDNDDDDDDDNHSQDNDPTRSVAEGGSGSKLARGSQPDGTSRNETDFTTTTTDSGNIRNDKGSDDAAGITTNSSAASAFIKAMGGSGTRGFGMEIKLTEHGATRVDSSRRGTNRLEAMCRDDLDHIIFGDVEAENDHETQRGEVQDIPGEDAINDGDDDVDDDDEEVYIDDDDDDDNDDDAMDFVELSPFIRDDSVHRYRSSATHQVEKQDTEEDGDELASQVIKSVENDGTTDNPGLEGTMASTENTSLAESDNSSLIIDRQKVYILASMQVLAERNHTFMLKLHSDQATTVTEMTAKVDSPQVQNNNYLSIASVNELIGSINAMVKPPKKPIVTKIVLRRAPTQEEFFRGSLTRNPVPVNMLLNSSTNGNTSTIKNSSDRLNSDREATINDLRQYIANDLQMSDSAELIEIIVANKILDVNLKIRVVQQVLWKKSLIENPNSASSRGHQHESTIGALLASSGSRAFFSSSSAMSFFLSSSSTGGSQSRGSSRLVTADTPLALLPSMIATYRLAGVDGEATEETVGVSDLIDPEAASDAASPEEKDTLLEAEYGMTRYVAIGQGVAILLRSTQDCVNDMLRRIRRDNIGRRGMPNPASAELKQGSPCHGLILLRYCAKLATNRKRMLEARAPTILLALLLDILKILEESSSGIVTSTSNDSNPTAEILQELIELLASDISSVTGTSKRSDAATTTALDVASSDKEISATTKVASTMSLLLQSIETIALSSPLRIVVAKLLPFLTYGQPDSCRELALHFDKHINIETLIDWENGENSDNKKNHESRTNTILTNTFLQTAMVLPANDVCHSLRMELINCQFVERIVAFIADIAPNHPTPWTPSLWPVGELAARSKSLKDESKTTTRMNESSFEAIVLNSDLEDSWSSYYSRPGVRTAFKVLIGLCRCHGPTQCRIAKSDGFVRICHWLESTSNSASINVKTSELGLLAETLLDDLSTGNDEVGQIVEVVRNTTRLRKKELAQEQRNRALRKISSFGGSSNVDSSKILVNVEATPSIVRHGLVSMLAPVVGLFQTMATATTGADSSSTSDKTASRGCKASADKTATTKEVPSWLSQIEEMKDEIGLICAVCQEGRTLQPSELLGLYVYIKKVSLAIDRGGSSAAIDGSNMLRALPSTLPDSLVDVATSPWLFEWFATTQSVLVNLSSAGSSSSSSSSSSRHRHHMSYTTSVSAGNGIHYSCHRRARQADRSHSKAPKSEWEGAMLRNSRVSCNAIIPVVHGPNQSKVPLVSIESALSNHSDTLSNIVGTSSSRSTLWSVLHDLRLLLLRVSYDESLSADCGGGSLASNCQLIYHQIYLAQMTDRNATMDGYNQQSKHSIHVHGLGAGILVTTAIINADATQTALKTESKTTESVATLTRHLADAATMGALTSIAFHRSISDNGVSYCSTDGANGSMKYQWNLGNDSFLQSLVVCAGRRHASGITGSGCTSSHGSRSCGQMMDEDNDDEETEQEEDEDIDDGGDEMDVDNNNTNSTANEINKSLRCASRTIRGGNGATTLHCDDFRAPLRPLLTYYIILNQIHDDLTTGSLSIDVEDDSEKKDAGVAGVDPIEICVERLVALIVACRKCRSIPELLSKLPKSFSNNVATESNILKWFQHGMMSS